MADSKDDLTEKAHFDPNWIAWNGGYIHSNNVLFYFATSPFFDQVSGNQSLFTQWAGTPNQNDILGTRAKFEDNLRHQRGIQYVVEHDPLEEKVMIDGPNGPEQSNVWVIRKQNREDDTANGVTVLGYYYIVNDVIYQAPAVASVLTYRMLNTVSALEKVFSAPANLFYFSVSHGHTYHKPVQASANQATSDPAQQSKESTPMPGSQLSASEKPTTSSAQPQEENNTGARTVWDALRMTLQYGKEYADDISLAGEPGNFRFSKNKEAATGQIKGQTSGNIATPNQSRAQSMVPASSSSNAAVSKGLKIGDKGATTPDGVVNRKRRKSKASEPSP
ncbi:MED6 mediator sub complex component-domain-containing protein [Exophiala viscosa]|uniref:Mediator of RNA polymerase II transcription subunit 6 n=1 Tax=Exophiala viscosa TaxID=2486360 RepID=A0AAN6IC12_9EURO|nr:MED6 mediator sub complex component-domain-containing protein [Exophiala viscosa]KAI1623208.1 MED6 mediator sub complex component-domain-containing protein [Exophiala viscosa]